MTKLEWIALITIQLLSITLFGAIALSEQVSAGDRGQALGAVIFLVVAPIWLFWPEIREILKRIRRRK